MSSLDDLRKGIRLGRPDKQELEELYWIKKKSEAYMALIYKVDPATIIQWLIKNKIPIKNYYEKYQLLYNVEGGIPAETQKTLQHTMPFNSFLVELVLVFPLNCQGLVQVYLQLGDGTKIFPFEGDYIALDDITITFRMMYYAKNGEKVQAVISNYDETFAHDVQVVLTIEDVSVSCPGA